MGKRPYKPGEKETGISSFEPDNVAERLEILLRENAAIAQEREAGIKKTRFGGIEMLRRPISVPSAYSYFGLSLGIIPTSSIFLRAFIDIPTRHISDLWLFLLAAAVVLTTGTVGYLLGAKISKIVDNSFALGTASAILLLPFIGALWGGISGAAGGVFLFIFGALIGSFIGIIVGSVSVPVFALLLNGLQSEGHIDLRHLVPITAGISLAVGAFILGL